MRNDLSFKLSIARSLLHVLVWLVNVVDGDDGEVAVISEVAQSDAGAGLHANLVDGLLVEVEADGHGEEVAVSKTVVLYHTWGRLSAPLKLLTLRLLLIRVAYSL